MGAIESKGSTFILDTGAMRRHAASAARLVRALSNQHRLLVLCVLSAGELSVGELNSRVRLSPSALSQHLAVLRREGLVATRRSGQTIHYKVAPGVAMDVVHLLHEHYCGTGPAASTAPSKRRSLARRKAKRAT
jgi:ArsR family transcriptional regulator, virulence genes transcriptional regulator